MRKTVRVISFLLVAVVILALSACGKAPELAKVKDTFVALVEASYEINDIFFGEGLAVYERGGEFATKYYIYEDLPESYDLYEIVQAESGYLSADSIKDTAAKVYSEDYLAGIYTMAFDGYADGESITTARYLEAEGYFLRYTYGEKDPFDILEGKQRRYLFDTMRIVRPSSADYVNVEVESYLLGKENETLTVTLRFTLENGEWRLDSPTY